MLVGSIGYLVEILEYTFANNTVTITSFKLKMWNEMLIKSNGNSKHFDMRKIVTQCLAVTV